MNLLRPKDWKILTKLWSDVAEHQLSQPDQALSYLRQELRRVWGVYQAPALYCSKDSSAEPAIWSWSANQFFADEITPAPYIQLGDEWGKDPNNLAQDMWSLSHMQGAGQHRVSWRPQVLGTTPWYKTKSGDLLYETEVKDRLNATFALSSTLEFTICIDTHQSQHEFTEHDVQFAEALLMGLRPLVLRLAMSYGLLEGQGRLSPRERETLLLLLKGGSEKEIAQELDLSPRTLHQYVTSVYRKFNVRSRPELMALWLEPPAKLLHSAY